MNGFSFPFLKRLSSLCLSSLLETKSVLSQTPYHYSSLSFSCGFHLHTASQPTVWFVCIICMKTKYCSLSSICTYIYTHCYIQINMCFFPKHGWGRDGKTVLNRLVIQMHVWSNTMQNKLEHIRGKTLMYEWWIKEKLFLKPVSLKKQVIPAD